MRGRGGSSPLSRGIPRHHRIRQHTQRIIPALAGNTRRGFPGCTSGEDHPRSRGEYKLLLNGFEGFLGSSPLSRGIPGPHQRVRGLRGIIPALAGNTLCSRPVDLTHQDHPRSRGEYPCAPTSSLTLSGSSPLSRGIPNLVNVIGSIYRIIPALAGNTTHRG